ncbi:MAG TPA: HepT-like ribonuclease domain-containing protein [Tepidisphaeraceae bacterium]|jgi:uncharacterized protein with HEPN domain|nr:HepT-like ribonuclease domain-containing protein [Tepidisphaeraceae bacterium]
MKDERIYLQHMLETSHRIQNRMSGVAKDQFMHDEDLQIIAVHLLQIIGEAARLITQATRDQMPNLPWKYITGMRHRIVHDYFNVNLEIVWQTVATDLPLLSETLENYLQRKNP